MAKDNVHNLHDGKDDADDGDVEGPKSVEELEEARRRVAEEEAERQRQQEEADGQFALEIPEAARKISLGTVIPRGTPTEIKYKMSGKSIPNVKGGILDPSDVSGLLVASRVVESINVVFTRDADLKIEKATVYVQIGTRHVVNAHSEAGELLLRGEPEAA